MPDEKPKIKRSKKQSAGFSDQYRYFGVPGNRADSVAAGLIRTTPPTQEEQDALRYFGVPISTVPLNWSDVVGYVPPEYEPYTEYVNGSFSDPYRYFGVPTSRPDSIAAGLIATPQTPQIQADALKYFGIPARPTRIRIVPPNR
jgi:hypothetical protein